MCWLCHCGCFFVCLCLGPNSSLLHCIRCIRVRQLIGQDLIRTTLVDLKCFVVGDANTGCDGGGQHILGL